MSVEPLPDISEYLDLMDQFIEGAISAPQFEKAFLSAVKSERRILGAPVFPILEALFEDADAYVERPELRTSEEDLNGEQLRDSAGSARNALRELGFV